MVDSMTEGLERARAKQKDARLADKSGIADPDQGLERAHTKQKDARLADKSGLMRRLHIVLVRAHRL